MRCDIRRTEDDVTATVTALGATCTIRANAQRPAEMLAFGTLPPQHIYRDVVKQIHAAMKENQS